VYRKNMSFGTNLKQELIYAGMLKKELAAKAGINKRAIDTYVRTNSSMPPADTAVKIAKALGVTVEYLVTGKDLKQDTVQFPIEAKIVAEITAQMDEKNRKMAVAIIKSMKKQEDEEKKKK
jgi:transcriptional regulator with XRE-family HTH domain